MMGYEKMSEVFFHLSWWVYINDKFKNKSYSFLAYQEIEAAVPSESMRNVEQ